MATLLTTIPDILFPHELDELLFRREGEDETSFGLTVDVGADTALRATLSFGADGTCRVQDLAQLLMDYADPAAARCVALGVEYSLATGGAARREAMLLPSRTPLRETAAEFCPRSFLSLLDGPKQTTPEDTEHFAFLSLPGAPPSDRAATLALSYADGTGRTEELAVPTPADDWDVCAFTLRPADWQEEGGPRLASLTVTVGARSQELELVAAPWGSEAVEFRNSFGCPETLRLWEVEREAKPARSAASVAGRYRNYRVEPLTTFKGTTAPLLDSELPFVDDAVHALRLSRPADGAELSLTDSEWKRSSAATEMPRATLTWREAARAAAFRPSRPARVFDGTFDESFG